jgi:ankyrin repeat protein
LAIASQQAHTTLVAILLQHGASIHVRDKCGRSPIDIAINAGHDRIVQMLRSGGAGSSNSHTSGFYGSSGHTSSIGSNASHRQDDPVIVDDVISIGCHQSSTTQIVTNPKCRSTGSNSFRLRKSVDENAIIA